MIGWFDSRDDRAIGRFGSRGDRVLGGFDSVLVERRMLPPVTAGVLGVVPVVFTATVWRALAIFRIPVVFVAIVWRALPIS